MSTKEAEKKKLVFRGNAYYNVDTPVLTPTTSQTTPAPAEPEKKGKARVKACQALQPGISSSGI